MQRAAQKCAEERERDAELIAAKKALRSAALREIVCEHSCT